MPNSFKQLLLETIDCEISPNAASKILAITWLDRFDASTREILLRLCETDDDSFLHELLKDGIVDKRYVPDACGEIFFLTESGRTDIVELMANLMP